MTVEEAVLAKAAVAVAYLERAAGLAEREVYRERTTGVEEKEVEWAAEMKETGSREGGGSRVGGQGAGSAAVPATGRQGGRQLARYAVMAEVGQEDL